ncbi:hypothetical protein Hypma_015474 [Hypsizygus marmoreus]|uniref:N-acetyltransferase domain-containing protein n=1 Tax=Hypsizygus marmoreus TaxID=39966 RepID=A0A369K9D6_HYPMA|nr:hypothetical protein Hypma_015474 [Hypsizygus marmoreus]
MAEPVAQIRRFQASDDKVVRFIIGKASMESLAVANRRAYIHPFIITLWLILSYVIIDFMDMWPKTQFGFIGYLHPLPMLAATAVPIMFLIDWLNRPVFEQLVQEVLRGPDMFDILGYYSRSPSSGLWILDYGDLFVGLIALDASNDSQLTTIGKAGGGTKGTASTATIRHFYVDEAYRTTGIQEDLLNHAVQFAFDADPRVQQIRAPDSPLIPYVRASLRDAGFVLDEHTQRVGVLGWKLGMRVLDKKDFKGRPKVE